MKTLDPRRSAHRPSQVNTDTDSSSVESRSARDAAVIARLIWLRTLFNVGSLIAAYVAFRHIAISDHAAVYSLRAFFIAGICWLFLKEVFGWRLKLAAGALPCLLSSLILRCGLSVSLGLRVGADLRCSYILRCCPFRRQADIPLWLADR